MAFPVQQVLTGRMKMEKPKGISQFNSWHGGELRVPASEYSQRLQAVRAAMDEVDVLVIAQPEDIYYLTGFYTIGDSEPQSLIIPRSDTPFMVARLIEVDLIPKLAWIDLVWTCPDHLRIFDVFCHAVGAALPSKGVVGIQLDAISAQYHEKLRKFFGQYSGIVLRDSSKLVEKVRLRKSKYEIECISKAAPISEIGIQAGLKLLKSGVLLSDIHAATYSAMIRAGSEVPGYVPIIRTTDPSGHGSWMPDERVTEGNLVFLEMSACKHGHHSPLMRTVYMLSKEESCPPVWLQEAEQLIQKTFDTCLPKMVPGARACDIDRLGREIMTSNSFGLKMSARLGYSTGSTATQPTGHAGWGDADFSLVGHNQEALQEGMVFHFIPWFQKYSEPSGPIGLSDAVLVTPSGGVRFGSLPLRMQVLHADGSVWADDDSCSRPNKMPKIQ